MKWQYVKHYYPKINGVYDIKGAVTPSIINCPV